jgi:signal peptidase I
MSMLSKLTERGALWTLAEIFAWIALVSAGFWVAHTMLRPVRVAGYSMSPALSVGDVVLVRLGAKPVPGDIVLIREGGHAPVLHRVVELLDGGAVRTKGDANTVADPTPAESCEVLGRSVAVIPVGALIDRWKGRSACATMAIQSHSNRR